MSQKQLDDFQRAYKEASTWTEGEDQTIFIALLDAGIIEGDTPDPNDPTVKALDTAETLPEIEKVILEL